ncbi:BtpA/SgcQ family protein [Vagococcus humatus]|uniref:Photosystem I assembly BtpA n=1 Tax=Vagococcus humatus TaxID=1889241 RepID=A0A3S0A568_9ENTE|nr:BtpA/SgcQ family protein [Vagococcus humatus]RST89255.1 photosystem I assembly BtpA [Vagococcus humatus]
MTNILQQKNLIIGMVHLLPLPGTPLYKGNMDEVYELALKDALALKNGGATALMIENAGDTPFKKEMAIEQITALAAVSAYIKEKVQMPIGIDAAFCDYKAALSVATAVRADFVRLAVYVDTVVSACGVMEPCSAEAIYYRKQLQAENIGILADIQVKYSNMLIPSVSIEESAKNAEASMADAIIVTGKHSGNETPIDIIKRAKAVVKCPLIIGSGVSVENVKEQLAIADGAIVGTSLKEEQDGQLVMSEEKVRALMEQL